jgi:hypothetical protein
MPNSKIYQQLFRGNESFATTLITLMIDEFGTEFLEWTPYNIRMEIQENFRVTPTSINFDLLMAGIQLITQDSFYWSLPDFNQLCLILSGEPIHHQLFQPSDAAACAWGITEALLLAPPDDVDNAFSLEIKAYVGEMLKDEGILSPPDVLKIGHFDKAILQTLHGEFSDDPEMYSAIFQAEQSKTEDINYFIKTRLRALVEQLQSLELRNGKVEQIAEMMLKSLPEPTEDEPL